MIINNEIFESFINCKYKAYLKLSGTSGNISEYEIMQNEIRVLYKMGALKNILSAYKEKEILNNTDLNSAIEDGKKAIVNAHVNCDGLQSYCDLMEKISGKSDLGLFHYVPFVFIAKEKVSKEDKLMLAYNGLVIGYMQNRQPKYGEVIYGKPFKRTKINLDGKLNIVMKLIDDLKESCGNGKPPQLILNRHCQICEFKDLCKSKVVEKDDLSLLYGISAKEIETQNKKGIFSITQYSYTFRPRRKFRKSYPFNLKALAIREKKVYVYGKPEIPTAKVQVYLDVEGDPDSDFYYLIGVIVVQEESEKHYAFWAEDQSQEKDIFSQFLNIIKNYPEFKLYHYGSYETKFLQKMQKGIGGENIQVFNKLVENSMNVLSIIYSHVFFPTYSNGLKDIGTHLGFKWSSEDASGIRSLVWRKRWEIDRNEDLKEKLIKYNLEDCLALKYIIGLIYRISKRGTSQENKKEYFNVVYTNDLRTDPNHKFKKVDYCFPDLE